VFVREDLTHPQQVVQGCHAAISIATRHKIEGEHPSVIVIGITNELKLLKVIDYLNEKGIDHSSFNEQDLNDELTAVATIPLEDNQKSLFKKYRLLRGGKHV
jgi:hypothetical protein